MYATNHFETAFLNTLRGTTLTAPANMYLGLMLSSPGEAGGGTEIAYTGYARQRVQFTVPAFDGGVNATAIKNTAQITFPTSSTDAGTVTHIALFDSLTGGNKWAYGAARENLIVGAGEAPVILVGEIVFSVTGELSDSYKTAFLNVLRGQSVAGFTPHLSLWNGSPDGGGAELSGANYARVPLAFSAPAEQGTGQMMCQNSTATAFSRPTTAWGSWTHTAIYTAASNGSPVWVIPRAAAYQIKTGYMPQIAANAVKVYVN